MPSRSSPIPPRSTVRLVKLWPHARKQGHERGQVFQIGYYCRCCGTGTVWLVSRDGSYDWTVDQEFIVRHFEVIEKSRERALYGKRRSKIGSH